MKYILSILLLATLSACSTDPQPIHFGKDQCHFCKMTIMDKKFGAELLNKNGKALKFDSGECMVNYLKADATFEATQLLIISYEQPGELVDATQAAYLHGGEVNSPMGGQLAAFKTKEAAEKFQPSMNADLLLWADVQQLDF